MGVTFSLSQMLKSLYLVGMMLGIAMMSRTKLLYLVILITIIFLPVLSNILFYKGRTNTFYDDIAFMSKVLTFPVSYLFFICLSKKFIWMNRYLQKHANILFFIIFFALLLSLLGFGNSNYGQVGGEEGDGMSYGYKGYFIAGNEISALFVILYSYFCYYLYKRVKNIFLLIGGLILGMIVAVLIVSKTVLAAYLIISILTPFAIKFRESSSLFAFTKYDRKFLAIFLIVPLVITTILFSFFRERVEANINRMSYNLEKAGELSSFLLSGRDKRINDSKRIYFDEYNWQEKLVGTGWKYPQNTIKEQWLGVGTSELDYLDLLISNGILGVLTIYSFWIFVFIKTIKSYFNKKSHQLVAPAVIGFSIIFCLNFISGHIMYSALLGLYLAYLLLPTVDNRVPATIQ